MRFLHENIEGSATAKPFFGPQSSTCFAPSHTLSRFGPSCVKGSCSSLTFLFSNLNSCQKKSDCFFFLGQSLLSCPSHRWRWWFNKRPSSSCSAAGYSYGKTWFLGGNGKTLKSIFCTFYVDCRDFPRKKEILPLIDCNKILVIYKKEWPFLSSMLRVPIQMWASLRVCGQSLSQWLTKTPLL